jgi:hypothetical protein
VEGDPVIYPDSSTRCSVCEQPLTATWVYHSRLDAYVCSECPLTDVKGEDISTHTIFWSPARPKHDEVCPAVDEFHLLQTAGLSVEMKAYLDGDVCQCALINKVREQYTRPTKWVVHQPQPGRKY